MTCSSGAKIGNHARVPHNFRLNRIKNSYNKNKIRKFEGKCDHRAATIAKALDGYTLVEVVPSFFLYFAPPPACFDSACQASKDAIFFASIFFPLAAFGVALAAILERKNDNVVKVDSINPRTGAEMGTFEVDPEAADLVARDSHGEIAYRAIGYTPWLTEKAPGDEIVRIETGCVGSIQSTSFLFSKILQQPSQLIMITLPRPVGIIFEEDKLKKQAVVAEIVSGSNADQLCKKAALGGDSNAPKEGDVLRACTTTNIVYKPGALAFGAQIPERTIVLFGADNQRWSKVSGALGQGLKSDGLVTIVLERHLGENGATL